MDLLGHIASWEGRAVTALSTGTPDPGDDIEEFNTAETARRAALPRRDAAADAESAHRALRSALVHAPDGLFEPGTAVRGTLDACTFDHYVEHTAQIRAWAATRRHSLPDARAGR
jgi:hypothetical protein